MDNLAHPDRLCPLCGTARWGRVVARDVLRHPADLVECLACGLRSYDWHGPKTTPEEFYNTAAYDDFTIHHIKYGTPCPPTLSVAEQYSVIDGYYDAMIRTTLELSGAQAGLARMYEVGAGWGWVMLRVREMGIDIAGCDMGRENCKQGQARGLALAHCTFQDAIVGTGLDAIFMLDVIEHTETPGADIAKAFRALRPGGVVLVKTFYDEWHDLPEVAERLDLSSYHNAPGKTYGFYCPPAHPCHFSTAVLRLALESRGFQIAPAYTVHDAVNGIITMYGYRP